MDLKIVNSTLDIRETIFEGNPEQGFESDIILPDYCPDVRRILKCHVVPKISQCYQNGNDVNIDGFIFVKIYYLCDENKIHSYDNRIPFSKVLEIKDGVDGVSVTVSAKNNYVNCRALNQRRFDVRGAIGLSARVTGRVKEEVVSEAVGDGVQLRRKKLNCSSLCSETSTQFSVQEEETLDGASINSVIRSEATLVLTEVKVIPNKAILKGDLTVKTVYTDAKKDTLVTAIHTFPISRILDIDRLTADSQLEVRSDVVSADVFPKQDENGEFTKLSFDVKLNIFAKAFETKEVIVATDAYSTDFSSDCNFKKVSLMCVNSVMDKTFTQSSQIELSATAVRDVIDLWATAKTPVLKFENGRFLLETPVEIFAFFTQEDGAVNFAEKTILVPFDMSLENNADTEFSPEVKVLSCEYAIVSPNKVELRLEIKVLGAVVSKYIEKCISNIGVDYSLPKVNVRTPALTIYYCDSGEEVWNIAKKYNTSADRVIFENDLDCETVAEKRVLLIPTSN